MKVIAIVPALLLVGAAPPEPPATAKVVPAPQQEVSPEMLERIAARPILPQDECRMVHEADPDETPTARAIPLTEAKGGQAYYPMLNYDEAGCPDPVPISSQRFGR